MRINTINLQLFLRDFSPQYIYKYNFRGFVLPYSLRALSPA